MQIYRCIVYGFDHFIISINIFSLYKYTNQGVFYLKYLKAKQHAIYVIILILCAICLRVWLAASSWPLLNSDEGTIGIMALHIQQGARPIFFYGQNYMGALQAYVAAPLFSLFGASVFTLRLAIILFYGAFLITMYTLTRILYSKHFALLVLFLLSLGSNVIFSRQLSAIGGYSETIFFSALAFVLVAWLALSTPDGTTPNRLLRLCAYSAWGLAIGLGLWSDLLILPTVVCSGFFLVLFCWRELLKGSIVPLVFCLVIGAFPLIIYNLHAPPNTNSWSTLMALQGHVAHTLRMLRTQIKATTEYSIPAITGSPLCHHSEYQFLFYLGFQPSHQADATCAKDGIIWSGAYISLFALASIMVLISLYVGIRSYVSRSWIVQARHMFVLNTMRFCVLLSTFLTLYLYTTSNASLIGPSIYSRYLICLWISTPMVIWPLWQGIFLLKKQHFVKVVLWLVVLRRTLCLSTLILLCAVMLFGTYITLNEIPTAISANRMEQQVISTLLKDRITHVYSGYWTCDRIVFESQGRIICGVVNDNLVTQAQTWSNRYEPYYMVVKNDPNSSYLFEQNNDFLYFQSSDLALIERKLAHTGKKYRLLLIENYLS